MAERAGARLGAGGEVLGEEADIVDGALLGRERAEVAAADRGAEQLRAAGADHGASRRGRDGEGLAGVEAAREELAAALGRR